MSLEFFLGLAHFDTALSAMLAIFCFYNYSKQDDYIKLIGLLQLAVFICNLSSYLLVRFKLGYSNIPASIYEFILILIVSKLYNDRTSFLYRRYFNTIVLLYFIIGLLNMLFIQKESITSYNKLISSIIIICYTVFFFYRLIVGPSAIQIVRLPMFWFSSALLLYHAGTIFLFALTPYLTNVLKDNLLVFWSFNNILSIVQHLIILLGIYFHFKLRSVSAA
jgi:hypothetical protein